MAGELVKGPAGCPIQPVVVYEFIAAAVLIYLRIALVIKKKAKTQTVESASQRLGQKLSGNKCDCPLTEVC